MTADEATRDISADSIAQRDAEYLDAAKRGDVELAKRLLDDSIEKYEGSRDKNGTYNYRESVRSVGVRIGNIPESGKSFNTRENKYEEGVSLISAGTLPPINSFAISALRDKGAKLVYIAGDVLTRTGGDDEFVMQNAREITKGEYDNILSSEQQTVSDYVLSGALHPVRHPSATPSPAPPPPAPTAPRPTSPQPSPSTWWTTAASRPPKPT
jgi:hypothetical protein